MPEIRRARPGDARAIARISTESLGYACEAALVESRLERPEQPGRIVLVIEEDGEAVGFVQAELYQLLYQQDQVNVLGLAVRKDAQGKGYGTLLMNAVEEWAARMGCDKVRLNSAAEREDAHRFYEKRGYRNTKSQKRFVKKIEL